MKFGVFALMCHASLATHVKIYVCAWMVNRVKPEDFSVTHDERLNVSNVNLYLLKIFKMSLHYVLKSRKTFVTVNN